jgi:Tol biopolymer transport system component
MQKWLKRMGLLAYGVPIAWALVAVAPADATFPGRNGRIAFVQSSNVYTMEPDGSGVRQLTSLPPGSTAHFVGWSPTGRRLVFDVSPPGGSVQLWLMRANGSGQRLLLDDPDNDDLDPSFSPDGASVIFSRCQATCAIYRIATDGGSLTALTPFDPAVIDFQSPYSPDGTTIAFGRFSSELTSGGIYLMNADGSNVRPLTPPELGAADPDWSPDGSRVVFTTHCCDPENAELWTIRADGTQLTQLTASANLHDFQPSWSPAGDAIAFHRGAPAAARSGIYVMRPDGRHARMIERGGEAPRWGPAP